jgi:exopolyphosphatase/guanosine-5'-triphosphate,3'-diphosphate pyrophosphatase
MRVAIVDIGTNSTRLLVCEVENQRVAAELERRSTVTRLGARVDADGRLDGQAMHRVFETLEEYRALIDRHRAEVSLAVLTSAVREASNGHEFATEVKRRYRLEPHILSGDEEAQLTFLGATSERDPDGSTPIVVIDIGGGSTEIVIGAGRRASFHVSTRAGVVRQTERHLHSDPPTEAELDDARHDVRAIIAEGVPADQRTAVQHGIAVAGTATSLAAIAQQLDPYDPAKVHGYRLSRQRCCEILARVASIPLAERKRVTGLHPDRAPTIVAGLIILLEVMTLFGLEQIEVSEHDILRGAALGLVGPPPPGAAGDPQPRREQAQEDEPG